MACRQSLGATLGGGTDLERGYGDVRPEDPLFTPLLPLTRVQFQAKESVHKTPFWENFNLNSLNFHPNFSSQAPKFGNFQLTSPQIWKFSAHKPPFSEANVRSQAPHFRNPGRTPLPEKKLSAPPPGAPLSKRYTIKMLDGLQTVAAQLGTTV